MLRKPYFEVNQYYSWGHEPVAHQLSWAAAESELENKSKLKNEKVLNSKHINFNQDKKI